MMTDLKKIEEYKELERVRFFCEQVMFKAKESDLLTMEDMDEYKLPALNKLLTFIAGFRQEMASVNIFPQKGKRSFKNSYVLTDAEYEHFEPFQIRVVCDLFDPEWTYALHAGFDFFLRVNQDAYQGRGELADWININISHSDTLPTSLGSTREHVQAIGGSGSYFHDIPMEFTTMVSFKKMARATCFKSSLFNQSVEDACLVMKKIVARKDLLKVIIEKD